MPADDNFDQLLDLPRSTGRNLIYFKLQNHEKRRRRSRGKKEKPSTNARNGCRNRYFVSISLNVVLLNSMHEETVNPLMT